MRRSKYNATRGLKAFHARRLLERLEIQKGMDLSNDEMREIDEIVSKAPGTLAYKTAAAIWRQSRRE